MPMEEGARTQFDDQQHRIIDRGNAEQPRHVLVVKLRRQSRLFEEPGAVDGQRALELLYRDDAPFLPVVPQRLADHTEVACESRIWNNYGTWQDHEAIKRSMSTE